MDPIRLFTVISLVSLPTVMFGGYSLLRLLKQKKLTPGQITFFRAGHAHAGVLLVLSLSYYQFLREAAAGDTANWLACIVLMVAILGLSGGFFLHLLPSKVGFNPAGMLVTTGGAVLLALDLLFLAFKLLTL